VLAVRALWYLSIYDWKLVLWRKIVVDFFREKNREFSKGEGFCKCWLTESEIWLAAQPC